MSYYRKSSPKMTVARDVYKQDQAYLKAFELLKPQVGESALTNIIDQYIGFDSRNEGTTYIYYRKVVDQFNNNRLLTRVASRPSDYLVWNRIPIDFAMRYDPPSFVFVGALQMPQGLAMEFIAVAKSRNDLEAMIIGKWRLDRNQHPEVFNMFRRLNFIRLDQYGTVKPMRNKILKVAIH